MDEQVLLVLRYFEAVSKRLACSLVSVVITSHADATTSDSEELLECSNSVCCSTIR